MTPQTKSAIEQLATRYPLKRAALLPALWLVQDEEGWVSPEAAEEIGRVLALSAAEVGEAMSFYTMFARRPRGKHHIQVCIGICCKLKGGDEILEYLTRKLGVKVGRTTKDEAFHLSTVECLGSCGTAPMMQIDNEYYEDLTREKVDEILKSLK